MAPRLLIIVENLPVPLDRRVWQECLALRGAGWDVSVICPKGTTYSKPYEEIEGVRIYRHDLPLEAKHAFAFLFEYAAALFHEFRLTLRVATSSGFDVIQACNPPDLIFLVALPYKLFGKKFVFDHHDLCPELFAAKFGRKGAVYWGLRAAEWLTFKSADLVISANDTYRETAIRRGGKRPEDVVTVYSVPDRKWSASKGAKKSGDVVIGYIGIIAAQDGVDQLLYAVRHLADQGQGDIRAVIVGDGPELETLKALAGSLGIAGRVVFTGYLSGEKLLETLSSFDIGVIPDPPNEYNHTISMNKVFEYSALGLPIVAYALNETRRLLGDAAVYAEGETPSDLARAIGRLTSDRALREEMAERSRAVGRKYDWETEAARYVQAYQRFSA